MDEQQRELLVQIAMERIKLKSQLKLLSYFIKRGEFHERQIDHILDRLSYLDTLEERIKKMK